MGEVWLVDNLQLDRKSALKLIKPEIAHNDKGWRRFQREARLMAKLEHPNAVVVYDFKRTHSMGYIEMEFVRGRSLDKYLKEREGEQLPLEWIAALLDQLCAVLQEAHGHLDEKSGKPKPIIHRDLKPSNLMLMDRKPQGQNLKVLDFGIAKMIEEDGGPEVTLTAAGDLLGTPAFMSPEQIRGGWGKDAEHEVDNRSDLYSVGVLLYQLLTGKTPFLRRDSFALLAAHLSEPPPPIKEMNPKSEIPASVERLVMQCLDKDPTKRPQSAQELSRMFRAAAGLSLKPLQSKSILSLWPTFRRLERGIWRHRWRETRDTSLPAPSPSLGEGPPALAGGPPGGGYDEAWRDETSITAPSLPSDNRAVRRIKAMARRASLLLARLICRDWRVADPVDCTVFAPPSVARGDWLSVQVFAHRPDQAEEARGLAQEIDQQARKRGFKSLEMGIKRGTRLTFHLHVPGIDFVASLLSLVWQGRANYVHFAASAPSELPIGTLICTVTVAVDNIPVGSIVFKLEIVEKNRPLRTPNTINTMLSATKANRPISLLPVGDRIFRYKNAFISYAMKDLPEVLKRVQMLRLARIRYFQDVLKLEPGDRWERKLYRYIDRSDLFLLFWSTNAKESKWVLEEARYAIKRKGGSDLASPDIIPVIIEGPPVPEPPAELAHLHFNDYLIYFMKPQGPKQ